MNVNQSIHQAVLKHFGERMSDRFLKASFASSMAYTLMLSGAVTSVLAQDGSSPAAGSQNALQLRPYQPTAAAPQPQTTAPVPTSGGTDKPPVPTLGAPIPSAALPAPKAKVAPVQKASAAPAPVATSKKAIADAPAPAPAKHRPWWHVMNPLAKPVDEPKDKAPGPNPTSVAAATPGKSSQSTPSAVIGGKSSSNSSLSTSSGGSSRSASAGGSSSASGKAATSAVSSVPSASSSKSAGQGTSASNGTGARPANATSFSGTAKAPAAGSTAVQKPKPAVPKPPTDLATFIRQVDVQHNQLKKPTPPRDEDSADSNSGTNPSASKKSGPSTATKRHVPSSEFDLEAEVPVADDGKNQDGKSGDKATPGKKHMETASASEERKPDSRASRDGTVDPRSLDPMPHYRKSVMYTKSGDYSRALKEVNRALYLNPHLISARYQGALLFQLEGRTAEAIKRYRDVLDLDPQYTVAHINLGICYRKMNELDDAEDEYRQALEQNFYSLPAHYNLATVLIQKDDLEGALKELKSCAKLAPNNAPVHNNLGVIYEKRHYLEEAEDEFLKAMTLDPANEQFGRNLEHVRYKLKRKPVKA